MVEAWKATRTDLKSVTLFKQKNMSKPKNDQTGKSSVD